MPRIIIKLSEGKKSWYMEWCTMVDAPITYGCTKKQFAKYYEKQYGKQGMFDLEERLKRVEDRGTSSYLYKSVESTISNNRAGKNETRLTKQQIIDFYCKLPKMKTKEEYAAYEANTPIGEKW